MLTTSHSIFNSDEFIDTVLYDEDEERRSRAKASFKEFLQELGIYGQNYKISRKALDNNTLKHKKITAEGLTMSWTGDPALVNLTLPKERDQSDGMYHIVIKTDDIQDISL